MGLSISRGSSTPPAIAAAVGVEPRLSRPFVPPSTALPMSVGESHSTRRSGTGITLIRAGAMGQSEIEEGRAYDETEKRAYYCNRRSPGSRMS
jgi:hypothetical protein